MAFQFTIPNASIQDTLRYILNFINRYSTDPFVIQFAKEFNPEGDKEQFIKRIFDYICQNGFYKLDENGEEEVWTPAKTISTRNAAGKFQYDCKKITILLGSVLKAAGIDPVLKHIYYSDGNGGYKDYTHIYIIVPWPDLNKYLVVDPTNNCMWNTEVEHDKATLYFLNGQTQETAAMNLHLMGNNNKQGADNPSVLSMFGQSAGQIENDMNAIVGCPHYDYDKDLIGAKNDYFSFTVAEAALHTANRLNPLFIAGRAAFLGLLYLGKLLANTPLKLNWANRLAIGWQADKSRIRKAWWIVGGTADAQALQTAVIKGSGITISGPDGIGYDIPVDLVTPWIAEQKAQGMGLAPEVVAAAIIASAPVILELLKTLKGMGIVKDGDTDPPVPEGTPPPGPPPGGGGGGGGGTPKAGSMLDLSSPANTIIKAVFLMGISAMIAGPHFYILNMFCLAAIIYAVAKKINA